MNHREARLLIGGDPSLVSPELAEHLASCPECAQFEREMISLDEKIRRALQQPPAAAGLASGASISVAPVTAAPINAAAAGRPAAVAPVSPPSAKVIPITAARRPRRARTTSWSGRALAASAFLAAVVTVAVWALRPTDTLAHDVVTHIEGEPKSWASTQQVSSNTLNEILRKAGVTLDANSDKVMYARTCLFRGHEVPHLVVSTSRGPVTVLVLRYENVKARESFHEDGMMGVITPAPHGSIAVLAKGNDNIDEVAAQVQQSVRWLPETK
jgi:Protein of unknown function (DUF3379)